ncbi:MAG: protein translocase subunit SecD [Candidatus Kerfeldbacteria bacterium]|nr:protein translocase subunit SecD [Candidatus Kerfeldbacteria bacterium]
MTIRTKVRLSLLGILALALLAGIIDYPKGPDIHIGKWHDEIKVHLGLDLQGGSSLLYQADVSDIADADREAALASVRDVIEQRINAFGVSEPVIQTIRSGDDWRIAVELPGVTDIQEAIDRIGATPTLEFKVEGPAPIYTDEQLATIRAHNDEQKTKAQDVLNRTLAGESFEQLATENTEDPGSKETQGNLGQFTDGEMVGAFNDVVFNKATVGQIYPELVSTEYGYHIIRVDERTEAITDENGTVTQKATAKAHHILFTTTSEEYPIYGPTYVSSGLSGEQLSRADVVFDPSTGLPVISVTFNSEGTQLFAQITKENIGKTIAIYLDGELVMTPLVNEQIPNGQAVINGSFTLQEAKAEVQKLNAGALPVPISLVSQQNIGPSLGQVSIERSLLAGVIGLVLLSFFIIAYYRLPGVLAVVALGMYTLIVLAVFKLWPVTLTLAGIAGFILSIGMAVDANVLIFERLKEELRAGKSIDSAVEEGFKRAWLSIRDSNSSSLITCLILYWFGSSLIRGFAITLAIGIVISMFSAITITRNFLHFVRPKNPWWYSVTK